MIRVSIGTVYHYGIFVSENEVIQFGLPPIPENIRDSADIRVISTDIDTFSCGKIVERAVFTFSEKLRKFPAPEIISRARSRLGEGGYSLLHNNCEHFANECVFGVKRSLQEDEARNRWKDWQKNNSK